MASDPSRGGRPSRTVVRDGVRVEREEQTADAYREGSVCTACNTGWMSDLETKARPVLTELVDGRLAIGSLADPQRDLVSRWYVKTALMLASSGLEGPARRPRLYAEVRAGRVPARMVVVGHQRPPVERFPVPMEVGWLVNPGWLSPPPYTATDKARFNALVPVSFKVSLWLRHLTLTVGYWPDNTWEILRWQGMYEAISPSAAALRGHPWPAPPGLSLEVDLVRLRRPR